MQIRIFLLNIYISLDPTKKCEVPTDTYTAKIRQVSKEDYLHSSSVIYECKQGLFPSEEKREKRFCIDGNWTALPECRWKTCPPPPPELPNSEIQNSSAEYYHLQRIEYKCKPNYELEGPQVVTCNKGKWTPLPKCVYKKCLEPPSIGDGKYFPRNNKYDSGDEVEYHCDEGYNLIGSAKVRCEYGKWSPVPECKGKHAVIL
ncbi:coagulation factor XIII B chain-like [Protopterus annectens]|uniref:coagulation factor XIII B chain-like n=1 Tax=Protopterus annectens TaxID=7888 RepID=UPI001CFAC4AB|nr:coagulation factor XIII B chain-like [Protopterus annectens]